MLPCFYGYQVELTLPNKKTLRFDDVKSLTKEDKEEIAESLRANLLSHIRRFSARKYKRRLALEKKENIRMNYNTKLEDIFTVQLQEDDDMSPDNRMQISLEQKDAAQTQIPPDPQFWGFDTERAAVEQDNRFKLTSPRYDRSNWLSKTMKGLASAFVGTFVNLWSAIWNLGQFFRGIGMLFTHPREVWRLWREREANIMREHGMNFQVGRYFWTFLQFVGSHGLSQWTSTGSTVAGTISSVKDIADIASTVSDLSEIGSHAETKKRKEFRQNLMLKQLNYASPSGITDEEYSTVSYEELRRRYNSNGRNFLL
ncbi:hypothetical protein MP638_000257 [Amoeboaphelidium occidentale]|nr:hypothetical protein MP638_000257 [Amoeboaphelidium occidentale]